jgi:hypothetical protein
MVCDENFVNLIKTNYIFVIPEGQGKNSEELFFFCEKQKKKSLVTNATCKVRK